MAKNQNNKNSKGVCEKIYNAVSGGRKIHLISHQVQGSVSSETAIKSRFQNSDNPTKAGLPKKPIFLNQPRLRMIPIEFEPSIRPSSMSHKENLQTTAKNAGKEDGTNHVSEISEREIVINGEFRGLKGKMEGKTHGQVEKVPWTKNKPPSHASIEGKTKLKGRMASMAKTKSTTDNAGQEKGDEVKKTEHKKENDEFSGYIDHVKNKVGIVSNVGGGGVGRTATRRDSFNDMVSSYIKRAQMKIRTTTNFDGSWKEHHVPLKIAKIDYE